MTGASLAVSVTGELMPNMPEHRLAPLLAALTQAFSHATEFSGLFAHAE